MDHHRVQYPDASWTVRPRLVSWLAALAVCIAIWLPGVAAGAAHAAAAPATPSPYELPWPGGVSFPCVQGNDGSFSHTGAQKYAWDFAMPVGSVVEAARAGTVRYARDDSNTGGTDWKVDISKANYLVVDHGDGTSALYLHLMYHGLLVKVGAHVAQGQPIAYSGETGFANGPHLHFMVEQTDPISWFSQSLAVRFADIAANNGVPVTGGTYGSGNAPATVLRAPNIVNIVNRLPAASAATGGADGKGALDAAFIRDLTFPDGSTVYGGQTFTKAWSLRNDGANAWPAGSHLVQQGSSALAVVSAPTIATVPPGASMDVRIMLRAPTAMQGHSEEDQWRLATSDGQPFGPAIWLRVKIGDDLPTLPVSAPATANTVYFPQTGHSVGWPFLDFFQAYGGIDIFGYPRTQLLQEDGMTVQYFQRARFEHHPDLPADQHVQLTLLGDQLTQDQQPFARVAPFATSSTHEYFAPTGHSVSYGFLQFFQQRGGLAVFGYPISEELRVESPHGPTTVQYFQRARFEYHPEFAGTRYAVELGLLGDITLTNNGLLPLPPAPVQGEEGAQSSGAGVTATPAAAGTETGSATTLTAGKTAVVTAVGLQMHATAALDAAVTGYLAKGDTVQVLALASGWAQVKSPRGPTGWVDAGYLAV